MPETLPNSAGRCSALLYRLRVVLLGAAIFAVMSALAPRSFCTWQNMGLIVRMTSSDVLAAAGFTLVMICGQLDLTVGLMMTLGGMAVIGMQPHLGWAGAMAVVVGCGVVVGLFNGLLVAKVKINSFIVTLGSMTLLRGLTRMIGAGGSMSIENSAVGMSAVELLDPVLMRVLLLVGPVLVMELLLRRTAAGCGLLLVGGNRQTAWYAGIRPDRYVIGAFVLSAVLSAVGGAYVAMSQNTAMPNLGDKSLMLIVAAVIIGGTSMAGGKGSVLSSALALFALASLNNGLRCMGASYQAELMASGVVLAAVILIDAWRVVQKNRVRGQRHELLAELSAREHVPADGCELSESGEGAETMNQNNGKDRTFALACVAMVSCVAIVAIFGFFLLHSRQGVMMVPSQSGPVATAGAAHDVDVSRLTSADGRPLIVLDTAPLIPPARPADPAKLPEDNKLHWYDYEYAGWKCQKLPMPKSSGDGPRGKRVICLQYMDHPYWTAYNNGMRKMAEAYGVDLKVLEANNDNKTQDDQVSQAINERPDMVIITPVDPKGVVPLLRKLHEAGIPVIASNLLPVDEGMKYVLTWTGPDDWGQFRMLAKDFAKRMNYEGGYCIIRHVAGSSCFNSRTWSMVSELKEIAPKMKLLDMQSTDLDTEKTKTQVSAWLERYGKDVKGIVSADDSKAQTGINEACKTAGREDIIRVSAGNSKVGMDFIKAGSLHAITYQSAESDGALPMKLAADWFSGKPIEKPVYYLQKHIITAADVDKFLPAQW